MAKPILISGIQPSGRLHIGNYLGALKHFVELQESGKYLCLFFIADYHALTEPNTQQENKERALNLMADYLAAGLDQKKSLLFVQSDSAHHTDVAILLSTITPFGELSRMTQFKDKAQQQKEVNVGLFIYPELMSADILLYDAQFVPVGEDQLQHLELTRTLARKFNAKYGETLIEPKSLLTETPRVMSLDDPTKKMSKSLPAGCLFMDDEPEVIRKKIKRAVTDSGDEIFYNLDTKPAISNLLSIFSAVAGRSIEELVREYNGNGYANLKEGLADAIVNHLAPFQKKKAALMKKPASVTKTFAAGSAKASKIAAKKFGEIKKKVGLAL